MRSYTIHLANSDVIHNCARTLTDKLLGDTKTSVKFHDITYNGFRLSRNWIYEIYDNNEELVFKNNQWIKRGN
jgi:hypothetical protein